MEATGLISRTKEVRLRFEVTGYEVFEMSGTDLSFIDSVLKAIAREAMTRNSGARGLRAIMESCLLDTMYALPSAENVRGCVVNEEVVTNQGTSISIYDSFEMQT